MYCNRTEHSTCLLFSITLILLDAMSPVNAELVYRDGLLFDTLDMQWHDQDGICETCTLENGFFIPVEELTTDRPGYYFSESSRRWYDRFGICDTCTPENGFWIPDMYRYAPEYRQEREEFAHLLDPTVAPKTQAAPPPPPAPPVKPPVVIQQPVPTPAIPPAPPVEQKNVALCEQVLREEIANERGESGTWLFDKQTLQVVPVSSTKESVRGVAWLSRGDQRIRIDYDCVLDKLSGRVIQLDRYEGTPLQ
ncbi:MAG: hypothetical protein V2J55_04755 [Candidatus Competibacteraceae bacterium]|jgi:hypothetical protein|nr:hypothetical protein [Candidatus Competibacteraceae bacterium]